MAFVKTVWASGDVITAVKLNNAEVGIETVDVAFTAHAALQTAHGAVSAPTASKMMVRDTSGRSQVAAPSVAADIARKDTVDAVQTNLTAHATANAIDAHGTMPAVKVTHSVAQSIPNDIYTTLAFDTETYDTDTIHDTVTNNSRLTCKTAGKYLIIASLTYAANVTGYREVDIILNAATVIASTTFVNIGVSATTSIQATVVYNLAVNDYVEVQAYQNSGGALNVDRAINYSPDFNMVKVG